MKAPAKTKELEHEVSSTIENYLTFLTGLFSKHGKKTDFISEDVTFPFKFFFPLIKKTDAITVKKYSEYIKMTCSILSNKPKKVNIIIDMNDVRAVHLSVAAEGGGCGGISNGGNDDDDGLGLTSEEQELICI